MKKDILEIPMFKKTGNYGEFYVVAAEWRNEISEIIKQRRLELNYKQKEIADKTGLTLKTVQQIEKDCSKVGFFNVMKYIFFLEEDMEEIFMKKLYSKNFNNKKRWRKHD